MHVLWLGKSVCVCVFRQETASAPSSAEDFLSLMILGIKVEDRPTPRSDSGYPVSLGRRAAVLGFPSQPSSTEVTYRGQERAPKTNKCRRTAGGLPAPSPAWWRWSGSPSVSLIQAYG